MKTSLDLESIRKLMEQGRFIISSHARTRMFQRNISTDEIKDIVLRGEIVEEYADDRPCPSALILGFLQDNPYHIVVAQCEDHVRILTVYVPAEDRWIRWRTRRR